MPELQHRTPERNTNAPASPTSTSTSEVDGQDTLGNAAITSAIASGDSQAVANIDPIYTGIVLVGMGDYAHDEARNLNTWNRDDGGAKSVRQRGSEQDVVYRAGQKMDLNTDEGKDAFVATLSLEPEVATEILDLIEKTGDRAKDEMAQLVEVYIQAEQGLRDMQRMVLSGHSVGSMIWGDHNGSLDFDLFIELGRIFPNAAGQVKHLMLSACYSGGERTMQQYFEMFPNLESILAYDGSSPGTWSGALVHMKEWEKRTGDGDGTDIDKEMGAGTRKGDNIATWNSEDGYDGASPMPVAQLESELQGQEGVFERFSSGQEEVANSQTGPLRDYYNLVQRVLSHPETTSSRAAELSTRRDQTIRLLYWGVVRGKFANGYGAQMTAGYSAAGIPQPDFAGLTRGEFMNELTVFARSAEENSDSAVQEALRLLQGLADMDSEIIPTTWV